MTCPSGAGSRVGPLGLFPCAASTQWDLLMGWIEDLGKLGELRDKGLITETEFEAQKRLLLPSSPVQQNISELADEGEIPAELQELEDELEDAVADENALDEFECRSILAQAYLDAAQPLRAVAHCEALVQLLTRAEGPESERLMIWRGFLGRALTEARRYFEAIDVLSDLLVDRERILGPEDRQTLATRGNLARAMAFGGRVNEGILLAERLLADRLRLFGDMDPTVLDTLGHLAQFHSLAGNHETAVKFAEEQLEKREQVFDKGDPILEMTRLNLDVFRSRNVRPVEALAGLRERLETSIEQLGADHPETFTAKGLLAEQLRWSGAFSESTDLLEELLADRIRVLGGQAPATLTTSFMYGRALRECGRPEDSVTHLRALIKTTPTEAATPNPEHLGIRAELVLSLFEIGDETGAITELQVLAMDTSHLEPTHPLREWAEEMIASLDNEVDAVAETVAPTVPTTPVNMYEGWSRKELKRERRRLHLQGAVARVREWPKLRARRARRLERKADRLEERAQRNIEKARRAVAQEE